MWFLMIIVSAASVACQIHVTMKIKEGGLNAENSSVVTNATSASVSMGLILYVVASFGIEMYGNNNLDFFDYGEITAQGVAYIGAKIVGVVIAVESIINMLVCMAVGIKNTKECSAVHTESSQSTEAEVMQEKSDDWTCVCGRRNRAYIFTCACGKNKPDSGHNNC